MARMSINDNMSDEELMEHYQCGSYEAFHALYKRHSGLAYGYLLKQTMNEAKAQDILQTSFLKLHNTRDRYDPRLPFLPWFFTIIKNSLRDDLRKQKPVVELKDHHISTEASMNQLPDFEKIIAQLPSRYQAALKMRYLEELDFDDIAKKLKTSSLNVRKIISRAMQDLRSFLKKEDFYE